MLKDPEVYPLTLAKNVSPSLTLPVGQIPLAYDFLFCECICSVTLMFASHSCFFYSRLRVNCVTSQRRSLSSSSINFVSVSLTAAEFIVIQSATDIKKLLFDARHSIFTFSPI